MGSVEVWLLGSARNLAVMRIAVALLLLTLPEVHLAVALSDHLHGAMLWTVVPVHPVAARVAWTAMMLGGLSGLVGFRPRLAFGVLTAAGVYLLAIPQLPGSTIHYHHLLWLSALLVACPSGDAWSIGKWAGNESSVAHGLPIRAAWLVLGLVYFFPGLHKLLAQGLWWDPTSILYWKWAQSPQFSPLFHPSESLIRLGGLAVVVFELTFVFAVLHRITRPFAVGAALLFHAATVLFFDVHFSSLWLCLVVFVDWSGWQKLPGVPVKRPWRSSAAICGAVLLGIGAAGVSAETQTWPLACYPTFAESVPRQMPAIEISWVHPDGSEHVVPMDHWQQQPITQRFWGEVWAMRGIARPVDERALGQLWDRVAAHNDLGQAVKVRFYRANLDTTPEHPAPWTRLGLLHEIDLKDP